MATFNGKIFNERVFEGYVKTLPRIKTNALLKSKALVNRPDLAALFKANVGGNVASTQIKGRLGGTAVNYDGETDITADGKKTYSQDRVVVGRAQAWEENDFTTDITGKDFMKNIGQEVVDFYDDLDQDTLISIIKGAFNMTGNENGEFVEKHTTNITNEDDGKVGATTLNNAMQKALGENKGKFSLVIMNSVVATNLENLKLLDYMTQTDAQGIERKLDLATWNGRTVLIDDSLPIKSVQEGYIKVTASTPGALKVVGDNAESVQDGEIKKSSVTPMADGSTINANDYVLHQNARVEYTTYVLGVGAIEVTDCGAKVPSEIHRDPITKGGKEYLVTRQRKCFAIKGISFTKASMTSHSPTDAELENGANWTLVKSEGESPDYIDHRAIAVAQIISLG